MTLQVWIAFATLVTVLSLTPGPAVLLVLSQALSRGVARTAWTILGIMAANTLYFVLCGIGVSAVLIGSAKIFSAIKWIGAGYLILIGANEAFSRNPNLSIEAAKGTRARTAQFLKGFVLQASSPAALVFFVAVIPQFLNLKSSLTPQVVLLAVTGNVAELFVLFFYAGIADRFTRLLAEKRLPFSIQLVSGLTLMGAGIIMLLVNR
jgi:homoserine/homoserine lactone efflux protein